MKDKKCTAHNTCEEVLGPFGPFNLYNPKQTNTILYDNCQWPNLVQLLAVNKLIEAEYIILNYYVHIYKLVQ